MDFISLRGGRWALALMQASKARSLPPRPRPYNPTTLSARPRRSPIEETIDADWDLLTLDEPDAFFEEHSEIRLRVVDGADDEVVLAPITAWQDLNLPLPPPRPRTRR